MVVGPALIGMKLFPMAKHGENDFFFQKVEMKLTLGPHHFILFLNREP